MLKELRRRVARILQKSPQMFVLASKLYYNLERSFTTLSPGAPDAIREALAKSCADLVGDDGDYYEFGLFRGYTFWYAQQVCRELGMTGTRFYGFDSFRGLPEVEGIDQANNQFFKGQFACSREDVARNLSKHGVDWSRTTLIEGFFSDTLTRESKRRYPFRRVNVAFIDCDLYASTCEVLDWLPDLLSDGSILLFDDWHAFGEGDELGQPRAFAEFLEKNPELRAEPFVEFADNGKGFVLRIAYPRAQVGQARLSGAARKRPRQAGRSASCRDRRARRKPRHQPCSRHTRQASPQACFPAARCR
jgi:O-methyltransferase